MAMHHHFLIITYPAQGHINPALSLANLILQHSPKVQISFSTAVSAHRRMFSTSDEVSDGRITYVPYSDGNDDGIKADTRSSRIKTSGYESLSKIIKTMADRGRPVTHVLNTFLLAWACDAARDFGIPSTVYWIQPATVFAIYYHYFNGYADVIASRANDPSAVVQLPGLPEFRVRELPSFVTVTSSDDPYAGVLAIIREMFDLLRSNQGATILLNSFDGLEEDAMKAVDNLKLVPIGPVVGSDSNPSKGDLFNTDGKSYMEWLDSKEVNSVVYMSFGSLISSKKRQIEELQRGLKESGKAYIWVLRKDNREELGVEIEESSGENCMVVEWCSQVKVLSHPAVGCFVTHCGWNSTLESLSCGVPMVAVPHWSDQMANARLIEEWGVGVRGEVKDGVLEGRELKRCLEIVMGGEEIRRKALEWKEKARGALEEGGSSVRNFKAFLDQQVSQCK